MQETKITKDRLRNHFTYSWWKYLLLVVAAVFGWSLIYTSTAYRAPKDKRLDGYFVTYTVDEAVTGWFEQQALAMFPEEVEDSNFSSLVYTPDDTYYANMQLTTYMGAGEGDIYFLPRERFDAFGRDGAFLALEDAVEAGVIDLRGIDVSNGYGTDVDTGERHLYGIPMEALYGFMEEEYNIDNRDLVMCVTAYSQNPEVALRYADWVIETFKAPKPQWLIDYEERTQAGGTDSSVSEMPSY